MSKLLAQVEQ